MAFHYVDRIYECVPGKLIRGVKNVTRNEPFFYWLPDGRRVLSPAVITESMLQLGGWLKLKTTDFKRRPVILADERSDYLGIVEAGDQVDMTIECLEFGDDVVVTKGTAFVRGVPVLEGKCARGYLLPTEDFDDPEALRRAYNNIFKPDLEKVSRVGPEAVRLKPAAGSTMFEQLKFVDGIVSHEPFKKVVGFKNFTASEPYFESHFPRHPCVPGVLQLTVMGEVCQYLVKPDLNTPVRERALIPTFIQNVRFRKFVVPGDQCVLEAKVVSGDASKPDQDLVVRAVVTANDTRVMQAEMGFKTMFASALVGAGHSRADHSRAG
jgi:3-hydroxymyristoyl/3-hydroxydecanoyl-(acyl carrier protein) dehydratase